jgi:ferredoxin
MKKILADRTRCVGGGNCVLSAPQLFAQGEDDGLVQVIREYPGPQDLAAAELAVISCPSQALSIVDVEGSHARECRPDKAVDPRR